MTTSGSDVVVRRATAADEHAVLTLMQTTLGWKPEDPNAAFFAWKHVDNPFGASPAWVAEVDGELAGFRTFMRWRFRRGSDAVSAVRAVDTATDPAHQGKGIFTQLTLHALDELAAEGVEFVFNTPNDQSRPGYLKMGWREVGKLPVSTWPSGPRGVARMLRARTAADLWSQRTDAGEPAAEILADEPAVEELLGRCPVRGIATDRTCAFLRWRYGFGPLRYRIITSRRGLQDGAVIFRLRRRGAAIEAAVCDVLAPSRRTAVELLRRVSRLGGADYAISLGAARAGLPLPGQGPLLTHRPLTSGTGAPGIGAWALGLGDIELF